MKNGTINGIYIIELIRSVENVIEVHKGKLGIVELMDHNTVSLLTHNRTPQYPRCFRKNVKTDLKRVSINKIPKKTYDKIMEFIRANYGTKYGTISYMMNQAMERYIKQEKAI